MDIATLRNADFDDLTTARTAYETLATAFDGHIGDWQSSVVTRLHNSNWSGSTAVQVNADLSTYTGKLRAAHDELVLVSGVLDDAVRSFQLAQADLVNALNEAQAHQITVAADGGLSWEKQLDPVTGVDARQDIAKKVGDDITAALTEAAQADKLISDHLQKFIANATNGTGLDSATVAADQNAANHREDIPDASASPAAVNAWWQGLTPAERHHLIYNQPDRIGNRDGIPTVDRDQANRLRLAQNQAQLKSELDGLGPEPPFLNSGVGMGNDQESMQHVAWRAEHDDLTGKLKGLNDIQNRLDNSRGPDFPPTYLMGFDTQGNGHAIVAMNNPDTADNVLTFVPGTSARLAGITGDMDKSYEMENSAAKADKGTLKTTATIAWSGYDAPQTLPEASTGGPAFGAEDRLHSFETGLRATHEGAPSFNTIMGHSYGSTAVGFTMRDKGLPVDRAIFVGSPGLGVYSPSELHLDPSQVFVGRGSNDPIEYVAGVAFGSDPMDSDFGAQHLPTGDSDHSSYWRPDKPAWDAFGKIATGRQP